MATIVDSYSESNWINENTDVRAMQPLVGQSFTGDGGKLNSCKFYISKKGSPTGNGVAKIYAHTGTFGTSSVPGDLLATSDNFDVSTLTTSKQLITFTFSGAEKITLTNGTYYCVGFNFTGGDVSNSPSIGYDSISDTHPGNGFVGTSAHSEFDLIFYVYRDEMASESSSQSPSSSPSASASASASASVSPSASLSPSSSASASASSSLSPSSSASKSASRSASASSSASLSPSSSTSASISPSPSLSPSGSQSPSASVSPSPAPDTTQWTNQTNNATLWVVSAQGGVTQYTITTPNATRWKR